MAKILITGATGTIGKELTKHLKTSHQLTLVDLDFSEFPTELKEGTRIIETDLVERENWRGLFEGIEFVIQLAGEPDQDAEFYEDLEELNTLNLRHFRERRLSTSQTSLHYLVSRN